MRDEIHQQRLRIRGEIPLHDFLLRYVGKGMLRPQTHWIKDFHGDIPLDRIYRFEQFADEFLDLRSELKLAQSSLPHELRGSGDDYRQHYDVDSRDLIARVYKEEIALFSYSFDG
jgi:hypothetical protein